MDELNLRFGAFAPSIEDQLESQGLAIPQPQYYEKIHQSITMLKLHRYISEAHAKRAYGKLQKEIAKKVSK